MRRMGGSGCGLMEGLRLRRAISVVLLALLVQLAPRAMAGDIAGTLKETGTNASVAGYVYAFNVSGGLVKASAFASGSYTITSLAAGSYYVKVTPTDGHIEQLYSGVTCAPCTTTVFTQPINPAGGTLVVVPASGTVSGIDFNALQKGGRIAGQVTDAQTGLPISNLPLSFYSNSGLNVGYSYTDASGNYTSFEGFPAGTYRVFANPFGDYLGHVYGAAGDCSSFGSCNMTSGTSFTVANPGTVVGINIAVTKGGHIAGTVASTLSGLPIQSIQVNVYDATGFLITQGFSDNSGAWISSAALKPGSYRCVAPAANLQGYVSEIYNDIHVIGTASAGTIASGAAITVAGGATTAGVDFNLETAGTASGLVTTPGQIAPSSVRIQIFNSSRGLVATATPNGMGEWQTPGLLAGSYYARTSSSVGLINEVYDNVPSPDPVGTSATAGGTLFAIAAGADTSGIDFILEQGGTLSGSVKAAATNNGISGMQVRAYDASGLYVTNAITASNGAWSIQGLVPGSYRLRTSNAQGFIEKIYSNISSPGAAATAGAIAAGTPVTATAGLNTSGLDFLLETGAQVSGLITSSQTGLPINNATISLYTADGNFLANASSNASGLWAFSTGLLPGSYRARSSNSQGFVNEIYNGMDSPGNAPSSATIAAGTPLTLVAGMPLSNVNFALAPGGTISGQVTSSASGLPITGVTVTLFNAAGNSVIGVNTNASGVWAVTTGLAPGTYYARTSNSLGFVNEVYGNLSDPGSSATTANVLAGTPIAVTGGTATTGIDFALDPGGTISGVVTSSATSLPIFGIFVGIANASGVNMGVVTSNASGAWTFGTGLPAGNYYARTTSAPGYVAEIYNNVPNPGYTTAQNPLTVGTPIGVTVGATTGGINFVLDPGGTISGHVVDPNGDPIVGMSVVIYNNAGALVTSATTTALGAWTNLAGLPTGTYFVRTPNSKGYVDEIYNNILSPGSATSDEIRAGAPIAVTAGSDTSGVNFVLEKGGLISGTVTSSSTGLAVADVNVDIYDGTGRRLSFLAPNSAGAWTTTTGFPAGLYYARTRNFSKYIDQSYNAFTCVSCLLPADGSPINVTKGATTSGINFALAPGASIEGTVTASESGAPLSGVSVQVYTAGGGIVTTVPTDATGKYRTATGLPAGTYRLMFSGLDRIAALYSPGGGGTPCINCAIPEAGPATDITVTTPSTNTGYDIALMPGGTIQGTVTSLSSGLGVAGASVITYDGTGRRIGYVTADSSGMWTKPGLPPGTYFAEALAAGFSSQVFDAVCSNCDPATGTPLTVAGTSPVSGVDFVLSPGASRPGGSTVAFVNSVHRERVTLVLSVDPNALATSVAVEYGTTASYGQSSASVDAGSGDVLVTRNITLSDLTCGTSYHYRIVSANAAGVSLGRDDVFVTQPCLSGSILSVSNVVIDEGDTGSRPAVFNVTLAPASASPVTVTVESASNSATAGADYVATGPFLVTFAPGEVLQTVSVAILGDVLGEGNETFVLNLTAPSGATLGAAQGVATILDDDAPGSKGDSNNSPALARSVAVNSGVGLGLGGPTSTSWFAMPLFANRSYQISAWPVVEDGATGAVAIAMDLYSDAIGSTAALPVPRNHAGPLEGSPNDAGGNARTQIFLPTLSGTYTLRLSGAGFTREDVQLMVRETTLFSPWFFVTTSNGYDAFYEIHNNTSEPVTVTLRGFGQTGTLVGVAHTFTLAANATAVKSAKSDLLITGDGSFGGTVLTHDGAFGAVSGNTTTLSPSTGLSFDSPFTPRVSATQGLPIR
ncbi:MAG: carboxypeptidase regulatory-like domain-containing protein [Vicinamibacteria bacterium]